MQLHLHPQFPRCRQSTPQSYIIQRLPHTTGPRTNLLQSILTQLQPTPRSNLENLQVKTETNHHPSSSHNRIPHKTSQQQPNSTQPQPQLLFPFLLLHLLSHHISPKISFPPSPCICTPSSHSRYRHSSPRSSEASTVSYHSIGYLQSQPVEVCLTWREICTRKSHHKKRERDAMTANCFISLFNPRPSQVPFSPFPFLSCAVLCCSPIKI